MSNGWKIALSFVAGLTVGVFATKKYIEYKNSEQEEYCEDEVEEISECDGQNIDEVVKVEEVKVDDKIDYSRIKSVNDEAYKRILDNLRYASEQDALDALGDLANDIYDDEPRDSSKPYRISQEEFESIDSYESDEYTYYADGYITDSYGMPITQEDMVNSIGLDIKYYFDKYGEDQIWIRNERLEMDFSIIRDLDNFVDVAPPRIRRLAGL